MTEYPMGQGTAWVVCPECDGKGYIEVKIIQHIGGAVGY
jgi:hypothetical protein